MAGFVFCLDSVVWSHNSFGFQLQQIAPKDSLPLQTRGSLALASRGELALNDAALGCFQRQESLGAAALWERNLVSSSSNCQWEQSASLFCAILMKACWEGFEPLETRVLSANYETLGFTDRQYVRKLS